MTKVAIVNDTDVYSFEHWVSYYLNEVLKKYNHSLIDIKYSTTTLDGDRIKYSAMIIYNDNTGVE